MRFKFLLTFIFILSSCLFANAQDDNSVSGGRPTPRTPDWPTSIQETLAKGRIKQAEKDYQELLERGEEAAKLAGELGKILEANQKFSLEDRKKLERLEKLVKRIRSDLGGLEDEQTAEGKAEPLTLDNIIKNIQENTSNLLSEIKKIGRHTISVIAIESSNSVLKLIRFLRFNTK